jgi:carbon storage regulator
MLIVSRKTGERLIIADDIVVTVTQIERGRVRLGIQAPTNVRVVREEPQRRPRGSHSTATAVGADN